MSCKYQNCSSLTSISIPNSVTSIKSDPSGSNIRTGTAGAFQGCTNLTSITIPNSVKEIGAYSFCDCPNLKKIIVDDLTAWCNINFEKIRDEIGNPLGYAHHLYLSNDENTEITNLVIPSSVSSISGYAFYGCTGLTSVTIEKRDTPLTFGNGTFDGCDNISDVYCYTETLPDGDGFVISNATLHVPESLVDYCKNTAPWNGFRNIVALSETGGKPKKGDVNEDGKVDISDIVAIINIMAGGE